MQTSGTVSHKGKSHITNLLSLYDKVTHLVDGGKVVGRVVLHFREVFRTAPHSRVVWDEWV